MATFRYILRLSVRPLGSAPVAGLEGEPAIAVGPVKVIVKQGGRYLILEAHDFDSEAEAEAFLPRLKGGLWNLALEHNIAFTPFFERRQITRPQDPHAAARNLAKSFGLPIEAPVQPVHGLTEDEGYTIFRTDERIQFIRLGDLSGTVSTAWENVSKTLVAGIQNVKPPIADADGDLATAIDLYLSSFYETSIRARFLTLMTVLEVLAPVSQKHPAAIQVIKELHATIGARLVGEADPEARDALESLGREMDFRKETSIRRRIRRLVLDEAPLCAPENQALAQKVVAAYDLRGAMVHSGEVAPNVLAEANETALDAVKLLLRWRLGFASVLPEHECARPSRDST